MHKKLSKKQQKIPKQQKANVYIEPKGPWANFWCISWRFLEDFCQKKRLSSINLINNIVVMP